jgi:hypothetical protein
MRYRNVAAILFLASLSQDGLAGPRCAELPRLHALDFWIGHWSVYVDTQLVGRNVIERVVSGCAVTERWTDARGSEGLSLFYYDASDDLWKQVWVTDDALRAGGMKAKVEQKALTTAGRVRFQGRYATQSGAVVLDRTTLTAKADGTVHQLIEISTDEGKSWRTTFDAVYRQAATRGVTSHSFSRRSASSNRRTTASTSCRCLPTLRTVAVVRRAAAASRYLAGSWCASG